LNQFGDYSPRYFDSIRQESRRSADVIAPLVAKLTHPRSVVDVGCGTGAWAAAFKRLGVADVLGIDGDYCDRQSLEISPNEFFAADVSQPLALTRTFDLAVCLEVGEHLDAQFADQLVANLVSLAPIVLFSAAVPEQGGQHHVNEQWPAYWIDRFASHGYDVLDPFRAALWENTNIAWWYAQNLLMFVSPEATLNDECGVQPTFAGLPVVHPQLVSQLSWQNRTLRAAIQLANATERHARILLVDEARLASMPILGREIRQFPDVDGEYAGLPADSAAAIHALEERREEGFQYLVVAWPAFWWLDHYHGFAAMLKSGCEEITRSKELIVYRIR
jgi:SAM-dependent methyltransferase